MRLADLAARAELTDVRLDVEHGRAVDRVEPAHADAHAVDAEQPAGRKADAVGAAPAALGEDADRCDGERLYGASLSDARGPQGVERDRRGGRHVERVDAARQRDARAHVGLREQGGREPGAFRPEQEGEAFVPGGGDLRDVDGGRRRVSVATSVKPAARSGARPAGSASVRAWGRLRASPIEMRSERR